MCASIYVKLCGCIIFFGGYFARMLRLLLRGEGTWKWDHIKIPEETYPVYSLSSTSYLSLSSSFFLYFYFILFSSSCRLQFLFLYSSENICPYNIFRWLFLFQNLKPVGLFQRALYSTLLHLPPHCEKDADFDSIVPMICIHSTVKVA